MRYFIDNLTCVFYYMFFNKRNVWKICLSLGGGGIFKGKASGLPLPQATKMSTLRRMDSTLQQNGIEPFRGRVLKETLSDSWGFGYLRRKSQQKSCILAVAPCGSWKAVRRRLQPENLVRSLRMSGNVSRGLGQWL